MSDGILKMYGRAGQGRREQIRSRLRKIGQNAKVSRCGNNNRLVMHSTTSPS